MSNELAYCPFFVADFLVTVASWPADRVGAYALALFYQFEHGGVPADDEEQLALILHSSRPVARRLWASIRQKFDRRDDGLYWNARMEEVRAEATAQWLKAHERGVKGASARWGKGALAKRARSNAQANAQASLEQSPSNANQIQNKNQVQNPQPPSAKGARLSARKITKAERDRAEQFLANIRRCPHNPQCESRNFCIGVLVQTWRVQEHAGQSAIIEAVNSEAEVQH